VVPRAKVRAREPTSAERAGARARGFHPTRPAGVIDSARRES